MDATPPSFRVDPEIRRAATPPSHLYHHPESFREQKERILARGWHWIGDAGRVRAPGHVLPLTFLEGCLDEPVLLAAGDDGRVRCMSNVCTHRGALVVEGEGHERVLRCRYHGRRFSLEGRMLSMPDFEGVEGFPAPSDDLAPIPLGQWGPLLFASLDPAFPFDEWIAPVRERVGDWLPLERAVFDPTTSRDYWIDAHWALYCDNYLEEFHIPYVHGGSLSGIDLGSYRTERFRWGSLQLGTAKGGEPAFDLPAGHPDAGSRVGAFYFWLFPATMINVYPWGVSLNVVEPLGPMRTRVRFRSYVWDAGRRAEGIGGDLHRVEMEDEEVVESVQRGVRSRFYDRGRYSPTRETGTHHFHRLLEEFLGGTGLTP